MEAIKRPDGRLYRARKAPEALLLGDEDEITMVIVFGTHDVATAYPLAVARIDALNQDSFIKYDATERYRLVGEPELEWYRGSPVGTGESGEMRVWYEADDIKGRACVTWAIEYFNDEAALLAADQRLYEFRDESPFGGNA